MALGENGHFVPRRENGVVVTAFTDHMKYQAERHVLSRNPFIAIGEIGLTLLTIGAYPAVKAHFQSRHGKDSTILVVPTESMGK